MPPDEFDECSRFGVKLDPAAFLEWRFKVAAEQVRFRGWLDTRAVPFPGEPNRTCDTVAHLEQPDGEPWAVAVEFQTTPDPLMFARMLHYLSALWLAEKPDPEPGSRYNLGAVVVNLTGIGRSSRNMRWPELGLATELTFVEGNLQTESAEQLLNEIESGERPRTLLPWIPLMRGADQSSIVERWKQLAMGEPDDRRRSEYGGLALVFAEAAGRHELWLKALEGWTCENPLWSKGGGPRRKPRALPRAKKLAKPRGVSWARPRWS